MLHSLTVVVDSSSSVQLLVSQRHMTNFELWRTLAHAGTLPFSPLPLLSLPPLCSQA